MGAHAAPLNFPYNFTTRRQEGPMPSEARCIQEAERCEQSAAAAWHEGLRATLIEIAATWRDMAPSKTRGVHWLRLMDIGAAFRPIT